MQSIHSPVRPDKEERSPGPSRFDRFALLVVLFLFGITWPVLQLLGENAEFFIARRSPDKEIVVLGLVATMLIPALAGLLGSMPGRIGMWLGGGLIVLSAGSLTRLLVARLPASAVVDAILGLSVGAAVTWAFFRFARFRQFGHYLLPSPFLLLAVFLLSMPVGEVLRGPDSSIGNQLAVDNPVPVVMVVFDEFPVASIIDPAENLREDRYPNFARLASDGIWYSNAVTVQQQTEHSVPAMLTGRVPDQSQVPVTGHYPLNLFTALRSSHDLHVYEAITQLCPRELCRGLARSATSLVHDVGVVSGHILLPEPISDDLPPIDQGWGDFQAVATGDFDARSEFLELLADGSREPIDRMLADIREGVGDLPPLYYLHAIVPHHPWQYLPDGRSYPFIVPSNPASVSGGWNEDDFLVAQSMQRHLLQVGYADHVLGELIAALEETGVYDDALMVVVADHGIAIKPGVDHQRMITPTTVGEIAAVPLFVKYPSSEDGGGVDRRRALTIDIMPTIADVLGADLPGDVEGVSLLDPPPQRDRTTTRGPRGSVTYDSDGDEKLEVARRIEQWFPDGDPWALQPFGTPDLVGERIDADSLTMSDIRGEVREPQLYANVDTTGPVIPARVGAVLEGDVDGDEIVAVAVNGRIAAITRSYVFEGEVALLAMVEPGFFVDGANRIDLLEVTDDGLRLITSSG